MTKAVWIIVDVKSFAFFQNYSILYYFLYVYNVVFKFEIYLEEVYVYQCLIIHTCIFFFVKDEMFSMSRVSDKEKSESLMGLEPVTSQTPGGHSIH